MKKVLFSVLAIMIAFTVTAQSIIDAEDGRNPNDFYQRGIVVGKKAMPYPFLRESDVVWKTTIWRRIDMNESFNQYLYFPTEREEEGNTQNRINIVNLIIKAAANGDFEVYEDDDMKVPQEWEKAYLNLSGAPYTQQVNVIGEDGQPVEDEDGEYVMKDTTIIPSFLNTTAKKLNLKEFWYIDKQDTRQKVRIVGMNFMFERASKSGENLIVESFWVPMDFMSVRNVLVNANAYEENNEVAERSYDDIFIQRYFESYITRESNKFNRKIADYLTGQDAVYESQMIEERIFDIESDMWEY